MTDAQFPVPLPRTSEREALGAMGGYDYQIWRSIECWLTLESDEVLFLEGAEDIDRTNSKSTTTIQVKRTKEAVSLNSQRAREAIRNFWTTTERSPGRHIKFVYLTTSGIALEKDARFGGLPGVQVWAKAAHDINLAEAIRSQLLTGFESNPRLRIFLETASVNDLQERIIKPFTWLMEQPNVTVVEQSVLDRIADALTNVNQPKSAARSVKSALFECCWKQVLRDEPSERRLDRTLLRLQIEAATTITLELPLRTATSFLMATAQLASIQTSFANLALLQDQPPSPPRALLRRPSLVDQVSTLVNQRFAVLLVGSVFKGKSTVAQVVARDAGLTATWTGLSQREPAALSDIFKLLALTMDRPDGPLLLIFDDLDTSPRARRAYDQSLRQLVHRAEVAGKALLFTAQGHTEALEREVANSWGVEVIQVPEMSQQEIAAHCVDFGCASVARADTWSKVIAAQTSGHPALVHVRLLELSAEGWPAFSLDTLVTPSHATRTAKQLARDLLASSVSAAETEFALEAGEFNLSPTRTMLLNLAGLPPPLPGASAVLSNLTGRWIEELGGERYRVTQILRGEIGVTWTQGHHRAIHSKLYDAILSSQPLTPSDASALVFHAFIAMDPHRLEKAVGIILTAEVEIQRHILKHCTWVLPIETEAGSVLGALGAALPSLLHLQFLVAELDEPSRLELVARAWRRVIGPRQAGDTWVANCMLYNMTVLTKHVKLSMEVLLEAISSAVEAEEPIRSVMIEGLVNVKASMILESFAMPASASLFQMFLSLRAGNVSTREDVLYLCAWLARAENKGFAGEFDQMLDWPSVRDLGAFVHTAWVAEANSLNPEWELWLNCFDTALEVCLSANLNRYGAQISRAKSIVLSEYIGDVQAAFRVLDYAASIFGPSLVIAEQRITLLGQSGDHRAVLEAWNTLADDYGCFAVTDPFSYRRTAISAGKLAQFDRASQLFEAGSKMIKDGMYETRVGLLVDASYCSLRAGNRRRCSSLLARAFLLLPIEAIAEGDRRWEAIVQVANAVGQLLEHSGSLRSGGGLVDITIGRASDPGVAVVVSTAEQALRVELLHTQIAYVEASWVDACPEIFEGARTLIDADSPLVRLNACKAFVLRDVMQGTSPIFLGYITGLAQAMNAIATIRQQCGEPNVRAMNEEMLSGLITLGILLVRGNPRVMLESWIEQQRASGDAPLLAVLTRLHNGMSMTTSEAVNEAVTLGSGDFIVNFGAALRICKANDVRANGLMIASLRVASALNSGFSPFFSPYLYPPVARLLAERLGLQLRMPAQFMMPYLTVPAIAQTVRQVMAGESGLRELLSVGCRAAGVDPGDALQQF